MFGKKMMITASLITSVTLMCLSDRSIGQTSAERDTGLVKGHISSELLTGPECTSPVGLCTKGRFSGDIQGDFVFIANTLTPTPDTALTGVVHYIGDILIHTRKGDIFIKDSGAFNTLPGGTGDVGSVSTITSGTGRWEGASGHIHIAGTFTPAGGGDSDFEGEISMLKR
jgi:hypothetical protein